MEKRNVIAAFGITGRLAHLVRELRVMNGESLPVIVRMALNGFIDAGLAERLPRDGYKDSLIVGQVRLPGYLEEKLTVIEKGTGRKRTEIAKRALEWFCEQSTVSKDE